MNCMMGGMAPVMVLLMMGRDMRAMWPGEPLFWMVMSLGVIAGFAVAYPVNVWLVAHGMKHGLMTDRGASSKGETMAGMDHSKMHMAESQGTHGQAGGSGMHTDVTRAQLVTVTSFTLLMLAAGMTVPAAFVNVRLSAHDVRGAIMPPGMIMTEDTSAAAMLDMAAVDPRDVTARYGLDTQGAQPLAPRIEDGVKVFDLETSVIRWQILPTVSVNAYAFNGQVPGPTLRFRQGDRVRINVTNRLPDTTTVHWHGLVLPNVMDGVANVTQKPIDRGQLYRYEFTAVQSGSFFYHSHDHVDRQQALGLYGALIIDPVSPADEIAADHEYTIQLQEWLIREGLTYPAMPMDGAQPNYFTINGRAFPSTDMIRMKVGETLKVRFIGSNSGFIHPMHIHGGPFVVVARDGETLAPSERFKADTVNVGPGQRYDVIWTARKPGKWMIHCHISHHTTNNNTEQDGGGGLMMHIEVEGDPTS
jgi:FtsP/CotA-like multicopper oxidase with cupredoxin domain